MSEDTQEVPVYDIVFFQGADESIEFQYFDENDQPANLTGYTSVFQVRDRIGGNLLLDLTTENGGIVITPNEGKTTVLKSHLVNQDWEHGEYEWWLFSPEDTQSPHLRGHIHLIQSVYKPPQAV